MVLLEPRSPVFFGLEKPDRGLIWCHRSHPNRECWAKQLGVISEAITFIAWLSALSKGTVWSRIVRMLMGLIKRHSTGEVDNCYAEGPRHVSNPIATPWRIAVV